MFIFGLVITGGAVVGSWGLAKYTHNQKTTTLVKVLESPKHPNDYPKYIGFFSQTGKILAQKLSPNHLIPIEHKQQLQSLTKQVDDRYQMMIHNTIDRMFGTHYNKHLQALGGTAGIDAIPPIVRKRNRQAGYAATSFALVMTGVPFLVLSAFAINLYLGSVMIELGIRDMMEKRTLTARGRNVFVYLGVILSGHLAVQSAGMMMGLLIEKFIATVQGQSRERLVNVFGELPQTVSRLENGLIIERALAEVQAGDIVVVYAGGVIPVDGKIVSGYASVDQHALTGEAQPVEKEVGEGVFASTLVLMGEIRVEVAQANADTLAAQITEILNNTRSHDTKMGLRGVEIADKTVLPTTILGLLVFPFWGISTMLAIWSAQLGGILRATTPLSLLAHLDMSARANILIKDGRSIELLNNIDTIVFDKTGTLTLDQPTVCGVHVCGNWEEDKLLAMAAAIEQHQSHPIAAAIRDTAADQMLMLPAVDKTSVEVGYGLSVMVDEQRVQLGSQRYMTLSNVTIPDELQQLSDEQQAIGHSIVYLAADGILQGAIELQPTVRPEARAVVDALHQRGIELAMITGDQEAPALALAKTLGIDRVFANVLPEEKASLVRELQDKEHQVMFVGDGINDSIALKQAQVSVSIAGATTVAVDTAQIVLMDGTLIQLDTLFDLSERYERALKSQYILGIHVPAIYIAGAMTFGWGIASSYVAGPIIFCTAFALAFRPIWQQERIESQMQASEQILLTESSTSTNED